MDSHFEGFSVKEHLKKARERGRYAQREMHVAETPDHISAGADGAKETAIAALLLWILLMQMRVSSAHIHYGLFSIAIGWLIWRVGRTAIIGWSRLERVNQLIASEHKEIEENRDEEREELRALYAAKGLSGKLLDQVIDVLMSDDSRLLQLMLEEELGLQLENYDHPIKIAFGAGCGVFMSAVALALGLFISPSFGLPIVAIVLVALSSLIMTKISGLRKMPSLMWNLCITLVTGLAVLILLRMFFGAAS